MSKIAYELEGNMKYTSEPNDTVKPRVPVVA
jgi:hypothetical protein